jgi:hypothetical protein
MVYISSAHGELRKVKGVKLVGRPLKIDNLKRFLARPDELTLRHLWHIRAAGKDVAAVQVFNPDHWCKILIPVDPTVVRKLLLDADSLPDRCASLLSATFEADMMLEDAKGWEKSRIRKFTSAYRLPEDESDELFTSRKIAKAKQLRGSKLLMNEIPEEVMAIVVSLLAVRDLYRLGGACRAQRQFVLGITHGLKVQSVYRRGAMITKGELLANIPAQRVPWNGTALKEAHEAIELAVAVYGFKDLAAAQRTHLEVKLAHESRMTELEEWLGRKSELGHDPVRSLLHQPYWKGGDYRKNVMPKTSAWLRRVKTVKVTFAEVKSELEHVRPKMFNADRMAWSKKLEIARTSLGMNSLYGPHFRQRLEIYLHTADFL